jgi:hypothetical protein
MFPSDLARAPAIPKPSYRQQVRYSQVRHAKAVVSAALHAPMVHSLIDGWVCAMRFIAPDGGRFTSRPVPYARTADGDLIVLVEFPSRDRWWCVFTMPYPVEVLLHRQWHHGLARAVAHGQYGWWRAQRAYAECFARVPLDDADIFVVVTLRPGSVG